jgi:hypothetical protein
VLQLQLLDLTETEELPVPIDAIARAELVGLMARVLMVVSQTRGGGDDDRTSVQSQD